MSIDELLSGESKLERCSEIFFEKVKICHIKV